MVRSSMIDYFDVKSVSLGSTINVGDSSELNPESRVFALQREYPVYFGNEGSFKAFPEFYFAPLPYANIYEPISTEFVNINPIIKVDGISINGISASSIFQAGSTEHIKAESRVKHVRHYLNPPSNESSDNSNE